MSEQIIPEQITPAQWRELNRQLVELQMQMAFQEDVLTALDNVVTSQQQNLDRLTKSQQRLERQLAELSGAAEAAPSDQRPPHY
ncbi:MAG TPA: SlyX family protein [Spongiibacteraceae bacterium]|nr:SlyX family protein [Spongiibacteraceae bacterium]